MHSTASVGEFEPQSEPVIRRLWQRMAEIYHHRWTSAMGDDAGASTGRVWAKGLSGLSLVQIGAGIDALLVRADGWPPTLPEFRAMCMGVPSLADVQVALRSAERSGFVRLVWQHLDGYAFSRSEQASADRMLRGAYELAREHVMRGGEVPTDSIALPAPAPVPTEFGYRPGTPAPSIDALAEILDRPDPAAPARAPDPDLAAAERELRQHYGTARELIEEAYS